MEAQLFWNRSKKHWREPLLFYMEWNLGSFNSYHHPRLPLPPHLPLSPPHLPLSPHLPVPLSPRIPLPTLQVRLSSHLLLLQVRLLPLLRFRLSPHLPLPLLLLQLSLLSIPLSLLSIPLSLPSLIHCLSEAGRLYTVFLKTTTPQKIDP